MKVKVIKKANTPTHTFTAKDVKEQRELSVQSHIADMYVKQGFVEILNDKRKKK